ncbi:MAG: molybdopterin-dependent oxidoreductase, partial [Gammaproteobacteria bacterium]
GKLAMEALNAAGTVIAFTPYKSASLDEVADVLLPIALYAENEGTCINVAGTPQAFSACVPPQGESRPAWKILRVLANKLDVAGCDYQSLQEIQKELEGVIAKAVSPSNTADWQRPSSLPAVNGAVTRISEIPMNSLDALVRHATALQETADIADGAAHINSVFATRLGLVEQSRVRVQQDEAVIELPYVVDDRLPDNTVLIHAAHPAVTGLGGWYSEITIEKV